MAKKNQLVYCIKTIILECYHVQEMIKEFLNMSTDHEMYKIYHLIVKVINNIIDIRKVIIKFLESNRGSSSTIEIILNKNILEENFNKLVSIYNVLELYGNASYKN